MATRTCNTCKIEKAEEEFYASSPKKCKVCVLKRQKDLKTTRGGGTKAAGESKKKSKRTTKTSSPPTRAADSLYQQPGGLGFTVQLEVDANTKTTDIRLTQYNATVAGDQNIWLSQHEARALQSWLADHLGKL